ncbi:unnamed protein product [Lactuca virosa]|uniref:Uncharacterized protein n=1 Tax=Lactuca virosa TaxID=75947 RepID=A0AAU9LU75_9ASTR|nr:unnamed protein product [Lactuca virosa]
MMITTTSKKYVRLLLQWEETKQKLEQKEKGKRHLQIRYKVIDEWRSWKVDGQIAGYIQGYDKNLTFLTVKGAGHRVPEYKPKEALVFYSHWLQGKKI